MIVRKMPDLPFLRISDVQNDGRWFASEEGRKSAGRHRGRTDPGG